MPARRLGKPSAARPVLCRACMGHENIPICACRQAERPMAWGPLAGLPNAATVLLVELRCLCIEHYKGYAQRAELELAPLTILVGRNNSGKTALAQAIQLLAGGLAPEGRDTPEPLPLESGGIRHGETFADLVTGRSVHGQLHVSASLADDTGPLSLSATVRNVETPSRPPARQIADWRLTSGGNEIALQRAGKARPHDSWAG